jgi:hypothetical protein
MDTEFCVPYVTEEAFVRSMTYKEIPGAFYEDSIGTVNSCKTTGQRFISIGSQYTIVQ